MVERKSAREMVMTRSFAAPARIVFDAWTRPELLKLWWTPRSMGLSLLSCEMDVRTGGSYRFVIAHPAAEQPMAFFGTYIDVTPPSRLVWTNEESADGALTTVTFAEQDGQTVLVMSELYPTKEAFDQANEVMVGGMSESFAQLDALLLTLGGATTPPFTA